MNPLCGIVKLRGRREDQSVDLRVVDRCVGCETRDLDVTEDIFPSLADVELGRVLGRCAWLERCFRVAGQKQSRTSSLSRCSLACQIRSLLQGVRDETP